MQENGLNFVNLAEEAVCADKKNRLAPVFFLGMQIASKESVCNSLSPQ